jgi:hypothetical protein
MKPIVSTYQIFYQRVLKVFYIRVELNIRYTQDVVLEEPRHNFLRVCCRNLVTFEFYDAIAQVFWSTWKSNDFVLVYLILHIKAAPYLKGLRRLYAERVFQLFF